MRSWQLLNWRTAAAAAAGGSALLALLLLLRARGRRRQLQVAQYDKDKVYLFNFPSCRKIVTISPFALKLETWLRLRRIPHETRRETVVFSSKGQIPFVELNGEELNESHLILRQLQRQFNAGDDELTQQQLGQSLALQRMLDDNTAFSYFYYRYTDDPKPFYAMWQFIGPWLRLLMLWTLPGDMRHKVRCHGMGLGSREEIYDAGNRDLLMLSRFLGDKEFLFGDKMTAADCCAFGHLAQLLYLPLNYPHLTLLRSRAKNLCDYTDRIRRDLWPDWEHICQKYSGRG